METFLLDNLLSILDWKTDFSFVVGDKRAYL